MESIDEQECGTPTLGKVTTPAPRNTPKAPRAASRRSQGRPPNGDSSRTRQQVLEAAVSVFAERGYHGSGTRELAARAGVTGATVYHYFPNKHLLYTSALAYSLDLAWSSFARAVRGKASLREETVALLRSAARLIESRPELTVLALRAQTDLGPRHLAELSAPIAGDVLSGMVARAIGRGELREEERGSFLLVLQSLLWGLSIVGRDGQSPKATLAALETLLDGQLLGTASSAGRF